MFCRLFFANGAFVRVTVAVWGSDSIAGLARCFLFKHGLDSFLLQDVHGLAHVRRAMWVWSLLALPFPQQHFCAEVLSFGRPVPCCGVGYFWIFFCLIGVRRHRGLRFCARRLGADTGGGCSSFDGLGCSAILGHEALLPRRYGPGGEIFYCQGPLYSHLTVPASDLAGAQCTSGQLRVEQSGRKDGIQFHVLCRMCSMPLQI